MRTPPPQVAEQLSSLTPPHVGTPPYLIPQCGARSPVEAERRAEAARACTDAPGVACPSHQGACDESPWTAAGELVLDVCRRSCGQCDAIKRGCPDTHAGCAAWASHGECDANPGWMVAACAWSCGACPSLAHRLG
jgi:hypothetical protein